MKAVNLMKKILSMIVILFLLIPTLGFAEYDLDNMSDEQLTALASAIVKEQQNRAQAGSGYIISGQMKDVFVGLKEVKIDKDSQGNKIAILVMDFSHTSDDAQNFMFSVSADVFQDGISREMSFYYSSQNLMTDIKKGAMIEVSEPFTLSSDSPIEIELSPMFSFDKDDKIATFVPVK